MSATKLRRGSQSFVQHQTTYVISVIRLHRKCLIFPVESGQTREFSQSSLSTTFRNLFSGLCWTV